MRYIRGHLCHRDEDTQKRRRRHSAGTVDRSGKSDAKEPFPEKAVVYPAGYPESELWGKHHVYDGLRRIPG